jgi:hypothetical protein
LKYQTRRANDLVRHPYAIPPCSTLEKQEKLLHERTNFWVFRSASKTYSEEVSRKVVEHNESTECPDRAENQLRPTDVSARRERTSN